MGPRLYHSPDAPHSCEQCRQRGGAYEKIVIQYTYSWPIFSSHQNFLVSSLLLPFLFNYLRSGHHCMSHLVWTEFGKKEMSTSLNSTAFLLHIFSCTWVWSIKILLHCPQKTAFNWHDRELFYYFMFKARSITPHPNTQREDI